MMLILLAGILCEVGAVVAQEAVEAPRCLLQKQKNIYDDANFDYEEEVQASPVGTNQLQLEEPSPQLCVPPAIGGCKMLKGDRFLRQLHDGRSAASQLGIIMAGLIREAGDGTTKLLENLRQVGDSFARKQLIIVENDSEDNTRELLQERCKDPDAWCLELTLPDMGGKQKPKVDGRIKHFTSLRQTVLDQVKKFVAGSSETWQFLLMFDGDIFSGGDEGFNPAATLATLGFRAAGGGPILANMPPDVICSNSVLPCRKPEDDFYDEKCTSGEFRDTFALRLKGGTKAQGVTSFTGNSLFQVNSCFSGVALYNLPSLLASGCKYTYESEDTCEHVMLHRCMRDNGRGNVTIYAPWATRFRASNRKAKAVMGTSCISITADAASIPISIPACDA
mmetsp:Transcript_96790/g.172182  ORF Transcript_96790/g.172182 Transcript_96790/m.172182 type:complete len:393 (-) Transcript_96790:6-1184(-)